MSKAIRYLTFLAASSFAVSGCAPDERMPLADCDFGLYWADCGGNGEAVLGCDRQSGECRWFSGGVTARGYAASTCPSTNPCCHSNWPFTDFSPDGRAREVAVEQLSLLGFGVISPSSHNDVAVQVDLTDEPAGSIRFCDPAMRCVTWGGGTPLLVGDSLVVVYGATGERWELEIVPGLTPDEWSVMLYRFVDHTREGLAPPLACSDWYSVGSSYLLEGVLHLSTDDFVDPAAVHGRLEASGSPYTFVLEF